MGPAPPSPAPRQGRDPLRPPGERDEVKALAAPTRARSWMCSSAGPRAGQDRPPAVHERGARACNLPLHRRANQEELHRSGRQPAPQLQDGRPGRRRGWPTRPPPSTRGTQGGIRGRAVTTGVASTTACGRRAPPPTTCAGSGWGPGSGAAHRSPGPRQRRLSQRARFYREAGAVIVALAERDGAIHGPQGLDADAVVRHQREAGSILGLPGATDLLPTAATLELDCDILIPAALENNSRPRTRPGFGAASWRRSPTAPPRPRGKPSSGSGASCCSQLCT